ncbi:MAG: pectinesterase family protein [Cyclobacteriaceae bacterium]
MKIGYILIFVLFSSFAGVAQNLVFDAVIAADGSGDYLSISDAISRTRTSITDRFLFYIKPGTYSEKISISKDNISLIGAQDGEVIITWDDYSGDEDGHTTSTSYTALMSGDGFYAENLTFENTAGDVGQAVAVSTTGRQQFFKNCQLTGFQDTYYANKGIQYFSNCFIEGATDFIFGESTAVFDNCQINCVTGGQYITAPADTKLISEVGGEKLYHGLLFLGCDITADANVPSSSYFLGRPWQPNSSSVYVECTLGNHIKSEGWSEWNNSNHLSAIFAEYQNTNPTGGLVDVSNRVSWSRQLTAERSNIYKNLVLYLDGWDVSPLLSPLSQPSNIETTISVLDSVRLQWDAVGEAIGYVVFKNDSITSFLTERSYTDLISIAGDTYEVAALNEFGNIGEKSVVMEVKRQDQGPAPLQVKEQFQYQLMKGKVITSEPVDFFVYAMNGSLKQRKINESSLLLSNWTKGVYIIQMINPRGDLQTFKVAL